MYRLVNVPLVREESGYSGWCTINCSLVVGILKKKKITAKAFSRRSSYEPPQTDITVHLHDFHGGVQLSDEEHGRTSDGVQK